MENASVRKLQEKEHFDRVITGDTANHEQVFRNSPVFISGTSSSDTFDTRHHTWTPTSFYNRNLLHHPSFTSVLYFYTNQLLPQTPFTPTSFYTRHLLHQPAFTLDTLYTRNLSRDTFHTRHSLHQTPFYTKQLFTPHILLHQTPFTPEAFYTKHLTSTDFYTTPFIPNLHTCLILLHQPALTPDTFDTNQLLHETPFTPTSFYTRQLLQSFTQDTLYTRQL